MAAAGGAPKEKVALGAAAGAGASVGLAGAPKLNPLLAGFGTSAAGC